MKLPQLSLRELFWLVLVSAIASAWWLDHRRLASQIEDLEETIFSISPARSGDIDL